MYILRKTTCILTWHSTLIIMRHIKVTQGDNKKSRILEEFVKTLLRFEPKSQFSCSFIEGNKIHVHKVQSFNNTFWHWPTCMLNQFLSEVSSHIIYKFIWVCQFLLYCIIIQNLLTLHRNIEESLINMPVSFIHKDMQVSSWFIVCPALILLKRTNILFSLADTWNYPAPYDKSMKLGSNCRIPGHFIYMCRNALKNET